MLEQKCKLWTLSPQFWSRCAAMWNSIESISKRFFFLSLSWIFPCFLLFPCFVFFPLFSFLIFLSFLLPSFLLLFYFTIHTLVSFLWFSSFLPFFNYCSSLLVFCHFLSLQLEQVKKHISYTYGWKSRGNYRPTTMKRNADLSVNANCYSLNGSSGLYFHNKAKRIKRRRYLLFYSFLPVEDSRFCFKQSTSPPHINWNEILQSCHCPRDRNSKYPIAKFDFDRSMKIDC